MELTEFGPDDADACAAYAELINASNASIAPWEHRRTPQAVALSVRHGWDGEPGRHFLGRRGGGPLVAGVVHTSQYDNLDHAWLDVVVHPDHLRNGHGSGALAELEQLALAMGRSLVGVDGWDNVATSGFAQARGYDQKSVAVNRRMTLASVDDAMLEAAFEDALGHAADYELVRVSGSSSPEMLEALAVATGAINDAPTDDLELEDEVFTADRVAAYEAAQLACGHRLHRLIARHRDTGEIGGHTIVAIDGEDPTHGDQHDTSVVRAHRGHRLGLLLKAAMVRWLAEIEPRLAVIDTWNAESNDHMIAVNERLGYQVLGRAFQFQRRL